MKDQMKEYCAQYHELHAVRNFNVKHVSAVLNVVWSTGVDEELTETSDFKLRHFREAVLPELESPEPFVFVQLHKHIFVYQFGQINNPELLLEAGKSGKEIVAIHFISDTMNLKKCQEVISQFPNLNSVYFDILGFDDDTDQSFEVTPENFHPKMRRMFIKTHKSHYSQLDEDKMAVFEQNCVGFLKKCEAMFPNLKSMDLEMPLEYDVHMLLLAMIQRNKIFKRNSWIGGFKHDKLLCSAPVTPEERRRLNPGIAALLCIEKPKTTATNKKETERGEWKKSGNWYGSPAGSTAAASKSNVTSVQKPEPEEPEKAKVSVDPNHAPSMNQPSTKPNMPLTKCSYF